MRRLLGKTRHTLARSFTLHRRLTLWTAGLLLVMGLGLVVLINSLTAARLPRAVSVELLAPTEQSFELAPTRSSPAPSETRTLVPFFEPAEVAPVAEQVQEIAIREVRIISLMGRNFPLWGLLGAIDRPSALRPVHNLSGLVRTIRSGHASRRLSMDGPQDEVKERLMLSTTCWRALVCGLSRKSQFVADRRIAHPMATLRANLSHFNKILGLHLGITAGWCCQERAFTQVGKIVEDLLLLTSGKMRCVWNPSTWVF